MVDRFDTKRGAYFKTSARVQLSAAYQRQPIFDYCTVDGVNDKNNTKLVLPDYQMWTPPTLSSITRGSANFAWLLRKLNWLQGLTWEEVPPLIHKQGLRYAQRTNDIAFCDAVRFNVQIKNKNWYKIVSHRKRWTPLTLRPIARGSSKVPGYLTMMVERVDTRMGAYLDTSAKTQLRVAHQVQPILRYCTV